MSFSTSAVIVSCPSSHRAIAGSKWPLVTQKQRIKASLLLLDKGSTKDTTVFFSYKTRSEQSYLELEAHAEKEPFKCYVTQRGWEAGKISLKKRINYKDVWFNVISVTRGWVGVEFA